MGFLRRRDPEPYFVEEPEEQPTVIVRPGGAMVDPEWLAEEIPRATADQERRDAEAKATRDLQEQDALERREAEESMAKFIEARTEAELPEHLKGRGVDDA